MEKKISKLDGCKELLEITLTKDELQPYYDKAYTKVQPNIKMQGFRPGKVPLNLVKKLYGASIEAEAQEDIINELFKNVAIEDKLNVVGSPELRNVKINEDGGITYEVQYEILPEVDLKEYKGLSIKEPVHAVEDSEIETYINQILLQSGSFEVAEIVTDDNHVVALRMEEIDPATGLALEGAQPKDMHIFLGDPSVIPDLRRAIMDMKVGSTFEFNPGLSDPKAIDKNMIVTITDIQKVIPAELTDEFVTGYTKGDFSNPDDFRQEIGFQIQEKWDQETRKSLEMQIVEKLVEMHSEVPVPDAAVEELAESMMQDVIKRNKNIKIGPDEKKQVEASLRPVAERNIRWEIIRNAIIEKEKLEVEDHDLDALIRPEDKSEEELIAMKAKLRSNSGLIHQLLSKKAMDFILDFAITEEVPFGEDDIDDDMLDEEFDFEEEGEEEEHDHEHHHEHGHGHDHDHEHK